MRELSEQAHGVNLDVGAELLNGLSTVDPADITVARFFVYGLLGSDYDDSPYTQTGERVARLAVSGIRLVIEEFRADVTKTRKDGTKGALRIDYGTGREPQEPVEWLWKYIDGAKTAGELYGRALVVIAAEQYASRLVVPQSQRTLPMRWSSHKDLADKALGSSPVRTSRRRCASSRPRSSAPRRSTSAPPRGPGRPRSGPAAGPRPPKRPTVPTPRSPARLTPRPRSTTSSTPSSRRARRPSSRPSDCGPGGRSWPPGTGLQITDGFAPVDRCVDPPVGEHIRPARPEPLEQAEENELGNEPGGAGLRETQSSGQLQGIDRRVDLDVLKRPLLELYFELVLSHAAARSAGARRALWVRAWRRRRRVARDCPIDASWLMANRI